MKETITIELTKDELRLLTSIMLSGKFIGLRGVHKDWQPVINALAEKLSIKDIQTSVLPLSNGK